MKTPIIKTTKLCKSFITGKESNNVLKNIDMELYLEDFTVIMGSSGSGKSTLLYSISTMDTISSGNVSLFGKELSEASQKELSAMRRKEVSFIFQAINLLPDLSAFENIAYNGYGLRSKKEVNQHTKELLERFGLQKDGRKYPNELSGGQQQRVAIARALINHSKVLFADEPTGALNSTSGKDVLDHLTGLHQEGQSIVMVTHDLKAAARGSRILYITDGRIDGDLTIGRYHPQQKEERENMIYKFLREKGW